MTCHNCQHCKARVGLLGRFDYCLLYARQVVQRCADFKPRGAGK